MRAREGLRNRGFIQFEEGVQNSRAPTYTILDTSRDDGRATASATAADTAGATSYTIHKSNTNTFLQVLQLGNSNHAEQLRNHCQLL